MTKLLPLIAAAFVATAGAASADNTLSGLGREQDQNTSIEIGSVRASDNGVVEVYDFSTGQQGRLLGSKVVQDGASNDVKVSLATSTSTSLLAVLMVDGEAVNRRVVHIVN